MDFNIKSTQINKKKYNPINIIKNNNIFTGSGGSSNIIILHDNIALKIIPTFKKPTIFKIKPNNDYMEIKFYKFLTDEFLKKDITPHIVGIYYSYVLKDIKNIFPNKCLTMSQKLITKPEHISQATDQLCRLKTFYEYGTLLPKANVIVLEKCPTTIEKEIRNILNKTNHSKYDELYEFIDRTIFQFLFTMAVIQKLYPRFIHNDMFIRNILGISETNYKINDYIEYQYENKHFYLPANGFYLKINDFGYSLNPPHIVSTLLQDIKDNPTWNMEYDDNLRDVFTFLYDYYNGANMGNTSAMKLLESKSDAVQKRIRRLFSKYIDVSIIDKIHKINENKLKQLWNIKDVSILRKTVTRPSMYINNGFFKKYYKLPTNGTIIKTFGIK